MTADSRTSTGAYVLLGDAPEQPATTASEGCGCFPHGPDEPCTCDGCWACIGHVVGCTCDIAWDCEHRHA